MQRSGRTVGESLMGSWERADVVLMHAGNQDARTRRRREDLGGFAAVKKRLRAHSTGRLAVGDQSDQRERWYGSLQSDWAVRAGGGVRGDCS